MLECRAKALCQWVSENECGSYANRAGSRLIPNILTAMSEGSRPAVLQVLASLRPSGSVRSAIDIARAVAEAGGASFVASAGGPLANDVLRAGAKSIELPLDSQNFLVLRRNAQRLARLIRQHQINIIHAQGAGPAGPAWRAAQKTGAHFILSFDSIEEESAPLQKRFLAALLASERVLVVSQFLADHLRVTYSIDPGRIRLIRRGVDLRSFDPDRVRPDQLIDLSRRWHIPDGVPLIMTFARPGSWSDVGALLEALARLRSTKFRCLLVGADEDAAARAEIGRQIARLELSRAVQLTGECSDMPAAYMLSDVVVSVSRDPGALVHVVTEAQAMGRPVVTTNEGGADEQVVREYTAWLVPPGDPDSLAEAIGDALALTPEQRLILGNTAKEHVRANFNKERMCAQTLAVYEELLRANANAVNAQPG
jgi:glycosyltransferase involved in cell wall biosynthesis